MCLTPLYTKHKRKHTSVSWVDISQKAEKETDMDRIMEIKGNIWVARSKGKRKSMKMRAIMTCARHLKRFQLLYEIGSLGIYKFKVSQVILLYNQG